MATPNKPEVKEHSSPLTDLLRAVKGIDRSSFHDDGDRIQALLAAYALVSRLETPWDTVSRLGMTEPALGASLKVVGDLRLFQKWHEAGDGAKSSKELAEMVGCNSFLLERILRHLKATNVLEETAPGECKPTAFSKALLEPVFGEWINWQYDAMIPVFYKMPEYLARTGYVSPEDQADGIFQDAKGFKGTLFDYYDSHPVQSASFNHIMGGVMAHQAGMLDIYPPERLLEGASAEGPLLVDVGGNVGHDIEKFLARLPTVAARLVLQDLPSVIRLAKCPSSVQVMEHDFFTPQPIRGARAYYLHAVIHDWSDEPARRILGHIKDAMTPGYSKLLVHDHVLPAADVHPQASAYDLMIMGLCSALERTEAMWQALLSSIGLKVIKIWSSPLATMSVIEAELA